MKAFDMVDPKLLLIKLLGYGFSNNAIELLRNYFGNRKQQTKSNYRGIIMTSDLADLTIGVPQGSVLAPLLFSIFINDLSQIFSNCIAKLFADDTTLIFNDSNMENLISKFKKDLKNLNEWCKHNRLYINWNKTFIMFVTNKRIHIPTQIIYRGIHASEIWSKLN